jgi:hypothetical protein
MWFALALLGFCAVFASWRAWRSDAVVAAERPRPGPGVGALLALAGGVALCTFLVRVKQPIGTAVLNFQLCFFPQYIAAFVAGLAAGRHGWLDALAGARRARLAGWLGVVGGPLLLAAIAGLGGPPPAHGPNPYAGGWNTRALALATWEQFAGLGLALGALAWFRHRWNTAGRISTWLSERAFAVYVFHAPVLVGLTPLVRPLAWHPFIGAAVLTLVGVAASFAVADLARRIPGLRAIL